MNEITLKVLTLKAVQCTVYTLHCTAYTHSCMPCFVNSGFMYVINYEIMKLCNGVLLDGRDFELNSNKFKTRCNSYINVIQI